MKVLEYARARYKLAASPWCWILEFARPPELWLERLQLGDASELVPGDRLQRIGGRKVSAGFTTIDLTRGYLEYAGCYLSDQDGDLALFRYSEVQDPEYFYGGAIIARAPLLLCYSTPAVASRVIETTMVRRAA